MTERWVKATNTDGKTVWINAARQLSFEWWVSADGTVAYTIVSAHSGVMYCKEPPEHFLPPGAGAYHRAINFIEMLAAIPEEYTASPSLVVEARSVIEAIRKAGAQW